MKALILGSEGFIGSHLANSLTSLDWIVSGCDIQDKSNTYFSFKKISDLYSDLSELLSIETFDVVINAAGSGDVNYSMHHPLKDFESNCSDTIRVLDAIRLNQPSCKYVHISSAAVYGNPISLPIVEKDKPLPLSPYGWDKLISEQLCHEFHIIYGLRTVAIRPFSVYGPGLRKQIFWDIYKKYLNANGTVDMWGTGKESRDFINIRDLVKAIVLIVEKDDFSGSIYNIASGIETTIQEVSTFLVEQLGNKARVVFNGQERAGDPINWRADISKLKSLGFEPHISIREGIAELALWLKNQN